MTGWSRRSAQVAFFALSFAASASTARAHATLLSSLPAAGQILTASPSVIKLVFSEEIVADMSAIELVSRTGFTILEVSSDPHDVDALVAAVPQLPPGPYRVVWRVISADGHPVSETFVFRVAVVGADGKPIADNAPFPVAPESASGMEHGTAISTATLILSVFRAAAVLSLMSFLGLLLVPRWKELPPGSRVRRLTAITAWAVPVTLAVHLAMWISHVSRTPVFDQADIGLALGSSAGVPELARLALGLLAAWAFLLARRRVVAGMFAGAAVVFGAAAGHPAAFTPYIAIPVKSLHLLGASVWLGGLLSIMLVDIEPGDRFIRQASRSSSVALIAVMAVTLTGVLESVLFLNTPGDLISSAYGRLVLAKVVGVIGLVAFGAYHRNRLMSSLSVPATARSLQRSVRNECVLMVLVMLVGAFMSNVPTPPVQRIEGHSMPQMEMT